MSTGTPTALMMGVASSVSDLRSLDLELGDPCSPFGDVVQAKLDEYQRNRIEDRRNQYERVVAFGFRLLICGGIGKAIIISCLRLQIGITAYFFPLCHLLICSGTLTMSTCPISDVDFDRSLRARPWLRFGIYFILGLLSIHAHLIFKSIPVSSLPPMCGLLATFVSMCWPACWQPFDSTMVAMWFVLFIVQQAVTSMAKYWGDCVLFPCACCFLLASLVLSSAWCILRLRGASATGSLYVVLYSFFLAWGGIFWLTMAAVCQTRGIHHIEGAPNQLIICCGVAFMAPTVVILAVGRQRFFKTTTRRLDRDRTQNERDGAFLAELLVSHAVVVGQRWWIYRGDNAKNEACTDSRKHFRKGHVVEVTKEIFRVRCREETVTLGGVQVRQPVEVFEVRNEGRISNAVDLLQVARQELRCIDWQSFNLEVMQGKIPADADIQSSFELSRPLRPGEMIDYFISHSWYDDPVKKYDKLQTLADSFYVLHQRYPTFWFDKVCIDQRQITDGLRVLPVNIMACSKMLILCGATYHSRLWCAWELLVLFSFVEIESAKKRVEFVPLDLGIHSQLRAFDVDSAHCFDPNEERRLRAVINALGVGEFNRKIRRFAEVSYRECQSAP
eukprot:TRINITY_DN12887_c0_g2_i1.p1 TRINITY_DN12887_c0_g2~~TRINITY_DN12887_c0_g2_i1.p1  ORF type:complete len:652 (+),score=49.96 TRINITY_DN12887_c0_g2_i1:110-1957(+)